MISKLAIDLRIATMASVAELKFLRMMRVSDREAFDGSYAVLDNVLTLANSTEQDYVWQLPKMIRRPS